MLELLAGIVESNENDIDVVHREAKEEAGCVLDAIKPIATFYPSAGGCSEQIRLFVGRVVEAGVGASMDSSMRTRICWFMPSVAGTRLQCLMPIKSITATR